MKLGILINEGPYQHQASDTALQYVKAAVEKGHEIYRVFFYNDGVNNATRLASPPQDDRNITKEWSTLAKEHNIDIVAHAHKVEEDDYYDYQYKDAKDMGIFRRLEYTESVSTTDIINRVLERFSK